MQNLTTLFGSAGATRFLALLASTYRKPIVTCMALQEDRSTVIYDFVANNRLVFASPTFTDETISHKATFTISTQDGIFDKYSNGSYASVLTQNTLIRYQKGLIDP